MMLPERKPQAARPVSVADTAGLAFRAPNLATAAANLLPLAGVLGWGWDAFQVVMLYWMETVIVAAATVLRVAKLQSGRKKSGGGRNAGFYALHSGLFILVHFVLLWGFLSGDWSERIHGPVMFVREMVLSSGAWLPLLLMMGAGILAYLQTPPQPRWLLHLGSMIVREGPVLRGEPAAQETGVGLVIVRLYARIVIMQITVLLGAVASKQYGSIAPLVILVVLKTLVDFAAGLYEAVRQRRERKPP